MKFEIESGIPLPEEHVITLDEFYNSMDSQKYRGHYERLMTRAQNRQVEGYTEKHHIIPKCLGGTNVKENYAVLTAAEHYVAHQLLVVLFKGNHKLIHAAVLMTSKSPDLKRGGNKAYSWLRKLRSESLTGKEVTAATRAKISKGHLGRINGPHSEETNLKISESNKGKICPDNTREAVAEANRNRVFTEEMRSAISERMTGTKRSQETLLKMSAASKGRVMPPVSIETRLKLSIAAKGSKRTEEQCARMSEIQKNRILSEDAKENISKAVSEANRTRDVTKEIRDKMSASRMGLYPSEESKAKRSATMKATLAAKKAVKEILAAWSCAI